MIYNLNFNFYSEFFRLTKIPARFINNKNQLITTEKFFKSVNTKSNIKNFIPIIFKKLKYLKYMF